jgi:hypothetical protein
MQFEIETVQGKLKLAQKWFIYKNAQFFPTHYHKIKHQNHSRNEDFFH